MNFYFSQPQKVNVCDPNRLTEDRHLLMRGVVPAELLTEAFKELHAAMPIWIDTFNDRGINSVFALFHLWCKCEVSSKLAPSRTFVVR